MTVREALDRAAELRPGCKLSDETRRRWLCEEDAMLRKLYFEKSGAAGYEKVWVLWSLLPPRSSDIP